MKAIAINGSPRKGWNTDKMLQAALAGAESAGAGTEIIHLYDHMYHGCYSCFACKKVDGPSYGRCAIGDALTPILDKCLAADVVFLGSPIYLGNMTGAMRSLLERYIFPGLAYSRHTNQAIYPRRQKIGLIYTMGVVTDDVYWEKIANWQALCNRILGETLVCTSADAYQFSDYDKYVTTVFDKEKKRQRYETEFPKDLAKATALGRTLVEKISL